MLDDASLTGAGQSSADVLEVPGAVVAAALTGHLLREIVRGSRGGALFSLASQLNDDVTHLQGRRIEGMLDQLVDEVRQALARLDTTYAVAAAPTAQGVRSGGLSDERFLPASNLPPRTAHFTGRDELLRRLGVLLRHGPVAVVALRGMGGIGKTQLALEFAHHHYAAGTGIVWWVRAEQPVTMNEDLLALAPKLALDENADVHAVLTELSHLGNWLLVYDNVTDPGMIERRLSAPNPQHASAGDGLPNSRRHHLNVPRPLTPESPSRLHSRIFTASMAFAVNRPARLSLGV